MAKKKDKEKNLLIAALIGVGFYLLTRRKPVVQPTPQNLSQIPPAPPANTPAWTQWVQAVVSVFGTVSALWAPGGPFYKQPITQNQALEIGKGQNYSDYA